MSSSSDSPTKAPRVAIILVGALALFQIIRTAAFFMIRDVLTGKTPEAWLFPAGVDVFVGVAALFVAITLWTRKGLAIWTIAIVFFSISISDHLDAITVVLNTKEPLPAMMGGPGGTASSTVTMLAVAIVVEAFAIWVLTWKSLRAHYLGPKTNPQP